MTSLNRFKPSIVLVALLSLLTACGGRSINKKTAQDVILQAQTPLLKKDDVSVEGVTQLGAASAVVEARMKTAFKLEKVKGKWTVSELKVGAGPWQKLDDIQRLLEKTSIDSTRTSLEELASAVGRYVAKKAKLPDFADYVALTDILAPEYINPLIRFDAWQRPFTAYRLNANTIRLVSRGPDGLLGTPDDIELTRSYPSAGK